MTYKYSILTFIIGKNYELVREIQNKQDDVEYILVTDQPNLKSTTWKVVYDNSLEKFEKPFERCFQIRYNVFDYCTTDICITIDGSMQVKGSLDMLVQKFEDGKYDICLMPHPLWANMYREYVGWVKLRNYPIEKANKMLSIFKQFEYDILEDNGLFQLCFTIKRRDQNTRKLEISTMAILKAVGGTEGLDRLDQTWFTFVMNTQFNFMKVLPVSEQIVRSYALQWYWHNTTKPNMNVFIKPGEIDMKYVFGKKEQCFQLM